MPKNRGCVHQEGLSRVCLGAQRGVWFLSCGGGSGWQSSSVHWLSVLKMLATLQTPYETGNRVDRDASEVPPYLTSGFPRCHLY